MAISEEKQKITKKIDFDLISGIFRIAEKECVKNLYEHEAYALLENSGIENVPRTILLENGVEYSDEELMSLPGNRIVMKIVSPLIIHKTELGGVKIIEKDPGRIRAVRQQMMSEVTEKYASMLEDGLLKGVKVYKGLSGRELRDKINLDIKGVLLVECIPSDPGPSGNELIVGIRNTREFGMVISAGIGGTDTELFAESFKKGKAIVTASTALTTASEFFELFKSTVSYKKLAGLTRGQKSLITDDQLVRCFSSFIEVANRYSPVNPETPYVIDELEVNPFTFSDNRMIPLDGMCRFSRPSELPAGRPISKIDSLLHPKSIAIIGVSENNMNFGRIILKNIMREGFLPEAISIIKADVDIIDGVKCVSSLSDLPEKVDLFVVAVGASQVPGLIDEVLDLNSAESILLIPGGLGEKKGSEERAELIADKINSAHQGSDGGPIFLGSNSMGIVSHPGKFDTIFIPEEKLPKTLRIYQRNSAFISQSGAFLITRTSKHPALDPAYMVSIGNQTDLTIGDLVTYIKDLENIDVIALYSEGFNDLDGLALCRAIRQAVLNGKEVVFYKAGRTPEGKISISGHTASVAGDYMVCESCVNQAGAMVADRYDQFEDLYLLALKLHKTDIKGNRMAAVSGAGFEAVGMADNIKGDDFELKMACFSEETESAIEELIITSRLSNLVDVKNPMDINPAATDRLHTDIVEALAKDPGIDSIVVGLDPLSPVTFTLPPQSTEQESLNSPESIVNLLPELCRGINKPVVGVVDGGRLYDPMVDALESNGIPVFRSSDRAVHALARYSNYRIRINGIRERDKNF
ncbi:acetate--CoA ligase family protein [Thermodesulfobacteriota bacterium]